MLTNKRTDMQSYPLHWKLIAPLLAAAGANRRLGVIRRRDGFDAVPPEIGAQLGERESGVCRDHALAQIRAGATRLSCFRSAGAQVQVTDRCSDRFRKLLALVGSRDLEEVLEVHMAAVKSSFRSAIIDHKDIRCKSFCMFIILINSRTLAQ